MAHVNIGFTDNRNSSRVLKPPGGDTSDIFGVKELQRAEEVKRMKCDAVDTVAVPVAASQNNNNNNETEIKTIEIIEGGEEEKPEKEEVKKDSSNGEEVNNLEIDKLSVVEETNSTNIEKTSEVIKQNSIKEILIETHTAVTETNGNGAIKRTKNRIPPGGYSSGLW